MDHSGPDDAASDGRALDAALLEAHRRGDLGALVTLYGRAGAAALAEDRVDAGCFYLTQALVFALEAGDPREEALRAALRARGRER